MNEDYTIIEFKETGIESRAFKIKPNGGYSYTEEYTGFTLQQMLTDGDCVRNDKFAITKVKKSDGTILEIGNKITSTIDHKIEVIKAFTFKDEQVFIRVIGSEDHFFIKTMNLISSEDLIKENPKIEVINDNRYSIDDIKTVLSKTLDKPELDQVLIDFKNYNSSAEVIPLEAVKEPVKSFVLPEYWHMHTSAIGFDNNLINELKNWDISNKKYSFKSTDTMYYFEGHKAIEWTNRYRDKVIHLDSVLVDSFDVYKYIKDQKQYNEYIPF